MTREEIKVRIAELKELKNMRSELDDMITTIEDELKSVMTLNGTEEMIIDEYKMTWKPVNSSRIDSAALKRDIPEIAKKYMKEVISRRFIVS